MRWLISIVFAVAITVSFAGTGYAFKKGEHDCAQCHTLSEEQAKTVLSPVIPNVRIISVAQGPVQGIWEVAFDSNGRKAVTYLDYSLNYLFVQANIFSLRDKKNLTEETVLRINKVDLTGFPYKNALVLGSKDAKHKVVVFDDPDWPFCGQLHQEMKKVISERKDIAFYIILYPLPIHKEAYEKSKAIMCEKNEKGLALLDDAFAKKQLPKAKCDGKVIDENVKLAQKYGITGTPAMIFPDGMLMSGKRDAATIIRMIDKK